MRKGEIACNKQFLLFSQCFLPSMVDIFHLKCTLKCRVQFVSIWTSLKFCCLVMGYFLTRRQENLSLIGLFSFREWIIAGSQQLLLLPQCFPKPLFEGMLEIGICEQWVNFFPSLVQIEGTCRQKIKCGKIFVVHHVVNIEEKGENDGYYVFKILLSKVSKKLALYIY